MRILKWMLLSLCAALMAGTLASGSSLAAGVVSEWSTDFGDMRLHVDDSLRVSGRYNHQGGEIKGRMTVKGRITAYWLQDSAGRRCHKEVYGTRYWGIVVWNVGPDGDLVGSWSYCRDAVGTGGNWYGRLEAGPSPIVLVRSDGFDRQRRIESAAEDALIELLDAITER